MQDGDFWLAVDNLIASSELYIDRPRGSVHPRHSDIVYPLDYGYLARTTANDGDGIDVWVGSLSQKTLTAVIYTVDLAKRDMEVKLLLGCTAEEMQMILRYHQRGSQSAMLVQR